MSFRRVFPAAAWFLRQLASRPARRVYISVLAALLIPAVALRIEAKVFQFRVLKVMTELATLRIGTTPKAEALSRIPGLQSTSKKQQCGADECFEAAIANARPSDRIYFPTFRWQGKTLNSALYWWGVRYWSLVASVGFTSGRVSRFGYRLILSKPSSNSDPFLVVGVWSKDNFADLQLSWDVDESPNYVVYHYFKTPDLHTGVYFTPDAPAELLAHAFDLRLHCLWSLGGCRTSKELLPQAEQDRLAIRRAALERLKGPDQCPPRILPRRARDAEDILLVDVRDVGPTLTESGGYTYRMASLRLLRVLKGKAQRTPEDIRMYRESYFGEVYFGEVPVHNPAYDLLHPGQRLILFPEANTCKEMDGSDAALRIVETALARSR